MRIGALAEDAGVRVRFRPFLLGPIFQAQGWTTSPFNLYAAKGRNMWRDLERLCADLGLPFRRPDPFPQNSLLAARVALAGLGRTEAQEFSRADSLGEDLLSENGASADSWRGVLGRGVLGRGFLSRGLPRRIRRRTPHRRSRHHRRHPRGIADRRAPRARGGAIGCGQGAAADANRGGAAARPVRRAELHHRGRRIVLGQRPARGRAALGAGRAENALAQNRLMHRYGSSRMGRPARAM